MQEDLDELIILHKQGVELYENAAASWRTTGHIYDSFWPNELRSDGIADTGKSVPVGVLGRSYFAELSYRDGLSLESWIGNVDDVLERIGKSRYKVQFNSPNYNSAFSRDANLTPVEKVSKNVIDNIGKHIEALRDIIDNLEVILESPSKVEPASYDPKSRTIFFADEAIRFNKNAEYSPAICKMMFEKPDKLWQLKDFFAEWDSLYEYLPDIQKPTDWNRVYDIIKKMNGRVEDATHIPDLFKLTTKSVRLNQKYVTPSKK